MIDMNNKALILLSIIVAIYLVLGGVVFHYLEKDFRAEVRPPEFPNITDEFLASHPAFKREEVEILAQSLIKSLINDTLAKLPPGWTISQGIYYSATIITTIGYGDVVAKTPGGQWFTVLYGVVGIPLNLAMLGGVGSKIRQVMKSVLIRIQKRRGENWSHRKSKAIGVTVVLIVGLIVMFICPALAFSKTEDWSFTTAFYFAFVTLSTVGLGDYVATRYADPDEYLVFYRFLLFVWIFLGLAWLSTLLSVLQDIYNTALETGEHKLEHQLSKRVHSISNHKGHTTVNKQTTVNIELNGHGLVPTDAAKTDHQNGNAVKSDNKTLEVHNAVELHVNEGYAKDITPVEVTD